ncbi:MAG TPA: hypothetical protein VH143_19715 [Kofleriaceae bacterium]|nr:hypothetical protein [Kofleriaceae bacterium]
MKFAVIAIALFASTARADDYCDFVQNVADATAATQLAPQLIGLFGYVEQSPSQVNPSQTSNLRFIAGINYRLTGIYEGYATKSKADADCRRHRALDDVRGETAVRAFAAKAKVLDAELAQADQILEVVQADYDARRTTAQETTALRLRVDELRELDAETHQQLAALPSSGDHPLGSALASYQQADADMEVADAKLRRAQLVDLSVRAGVDEFLDSTANPAPYFAVVQATVSFGALWQGRANERAAAARKRLVASGRDPLGIDATLERVETTIAIETKRAEDTDALVAELERQLASLDRIGGDDSKRYRQTVWFDYAKAKADQAYYAAHLASLHEVLGGSP